MLRIRLSAMLDQLVHVTVVTAALLATTTAWSADMVPEAVQRVNALRAQGTRVGLQRDQRTVSFIGTSKGAPISVPRVSPGVAASDNASIIAQEYGHLFGLRDAAAELRVKRTATNGAGGSMVRFQQTHQGLPVIGGELIVNMDANSALLSMSGKATSVPATLATQPAVSAAQAQATARAAVAQWYQVSAGSLQATTPVLSMYEPRLISPSRWPAALVWQLDVAPRGMAPFREYVLIDAQQGQIVLHFNQIETIKNRLTYDSNNTATFPLTLVCNEASGDACSSGANPDADRAHLYAGHTYDFYFTNHGRDSVNGAGMTISSNVHWNGGPGSCPGAFWDGTNNQMVYCADMAADDVVAHELTHGVTQYESNLFYYYQSGAINESFSDVWGEFVDMTNGSGTDGAAYDWKLGEDAVGMGVIRDLANPPAYNNPDRMTSALYYTGALDRGGVHTNSGVNNKAAYLMTVGGTFNGRTVTGLGITKVAKIYYEAQTNLLTSGSDYLDLYNALYQACTTLVGVAGITTTDCQQVRAATDAVEMNLEPVPGYNPEAEICPAGQTVQPVFSDGFEFGTANWVRTHNQALANVDWVWARGYAAEGQYMLWSTNTNLASDQYAAFASNVTVPTGQPYLYFRHTFDFEFATTNYYDGGVLEYSTNGGTTWTDAGSLINSGKAYTATLFNGAGASALGGRTAFAGPSHGYVSTRLNLATLAGQSVRFRWRVATNSTNYSPLGWMIDDVKIYTCSGGNTPPTANAGPDQTVNTGAAVTLAGSGTDVGGSISAYAWIQTAGTAVTLSGANTATASFTAANTAGTLTFQLTVTDNLGATGTDAVNVAVQVPGNGGNTGGSDGGDGGGGGGCTLKANGAFDPLFPLLLGAAMMILWRRRAI